MDKDPYLSELDAMDDLEAQSPEEATEVDDGPTRIDINAVLPPPPDFEEVEGEGMMVDAMVPAEDFSSEAPLPSVSSIKDILDLAPDLAVPLLVVMGRKSFTVQDLLQLRLGQIMDLDREPLEPVDLVAGGKVIGKGELVEVDGKIGVRILKLFK